MWSQRRCQPFLSPKRQRKCSRFEVPDRRCAALPRNFGHLSSDYVQITIKHHLPLNPMKSQWNLHKTSWNHHKFHQKLHQNSTKKTSWKTGRSAARPLRRSWPRVEWSPGAIPTPGATAAWLPEKSPWDFASGYWNFNGISWDLKWWFNGI